MKKMTRAAIATGAAAVLLLASAGTFAYWNDTANLSGTSSITAGDLQLNTTGTPSWKIKHTNGTEAAVANIATVRLVPGDKLTYTFPASITAQGQNLRFKVSLSNGSIVTPSSPSAADTALANRLVTNASFTVTGAATVPGQQNTFEHKSNSSSSYATTITATLTWPFEGTGAQDNPASNGQVNLSNFTLTVTQIDASI